MPAPARLLAALDNVLLGHADRTRIVPQPLRPHTIVESTLTVDGFVRGVWKIKNEKDTAVLTVRTTDRLPALDEEAVTGEAEVLVRFAADGAGRHEVRFGLIDD